MLTIALNCLVIAISLMTMVKPAHADGTVPSVRYYEPQTNLGISVIECNLSHQLASPDAAAQCEVALYSAVHPSGSRAIAYWSNTSTSLAMHLNDGSTYGFYLVAGPATCPANSKGSPCTCYAGYQPDPTGKNCVKVPDVACPVEALTAPPFNDVCAEVLENINSTQAQKDAACGALTDNLKTGMACFRDKLSNMSPAIPLKITSDIRDVAYQTHFRDVWDKMEDLVELEDDPVKRTACAARRAEIAAEKGCDNAGRCTSCYDESATQRSHCLKGRPANPSPNDAQHTQGNAFDVSEATTINPLRAALGARNPSQTIQQFLDNPTDCNLNWGGTFTDNYDPIHFYAR